MSVAGYRPRLIDSWLQELFSELPALMLTGPRACGKTTTANRHAKALVRLDLPNQRQLFREDPDSALLAYPEPLQIDEWQLAPEVLGAIKRSVDADPRPGRFLLTGSANARLEAPTWAGTGRVTELHMEGLTQREIEGNHDGPDFLTKLASGELSDFAARPEPPDLPAYIEMAMRGGFPDSALNRSRQAAWAWLDGYIDQLTTRDAGLMGERRDPTRFREYFEAICLNTAGTPTHSTLYGAAGINAKTAKAYDRLLNGLYMVKPLPAWSDNRLQRLVKATKPMVVDPALVAAALNLDATAVLRDSDLTGRLIETFVAAQIRAETQLRSRGFRLHHLREKGGGREIDLIAEGPGGGVVAIEVKATTAPRAEHAKHLIWLREKLGNRFLAGAVLHTGPAPHGLDDRIFALPLYSLWS